LPGWRPRAPDDGNRDGCALESPQDRWFTPSGGLAGDLEGLACGGGAGSADARLRGCGEPERGHLEVRQQETLCHVEADAGNVGGVHCDSFLGCERACRVAGRSVNGSSQGTGQRWFLLCTSLRGRLAPELAHRSNSPLPVGVPAAAGTPTSSPHAGTGQGRHHPCSQSLHRGTNQGDGVHTGILGYFHKCRVHPSMQGCNTRRAHQLPGILISTAMPFAPTRCARSRPLLA